jgi:hypothetical protein
MLSQSLNDGPRAECSHSRRAYLENEATTIVPIALWLDLTLGAVVVEVLAAKPSAKRSSGSAT